MIEKQGGPTVSVVVATYNMGQFIGECLESILAQTYGDFDVHVIDDGSTDDTERRVRKFLADPRVHYHKQANAGQTRAKNVGIRRSAGQFVAFCDADDMWKPRKLEVQMPLFDDRSVAVVYGRTSRLLQNGEEVVAEGTELHSGYVTEQLFRTNFVPFGTAVVRRACLDEVGGFDERYRMGIDWELWLRLSTRYQFRYVDEVTYIYRIWDGQMSVNWKGRYEHCFRIMRDFVGNHPGVVSEQVIRDAWADSFVGRGRSRAELAGEYSQACMDALRAVRYRPFYPPMLRLLARVAVLKLKLGTPRRW